MENGTFWDGAGGALLGTLGSALVAVVVVIWTRNNERKLMREQMSITSAHDCQAYVSNLRAKTDRFIRPEPAPDWSEVKALADRLESDGERIDLFRSMIAPLEVEWVLAELCEGLRDQYPPRFRSAYVARSEEDLERVARDLGMHLTNVSAALEQYLRAEYERDRWRRLRVWRRFKLQKAWWPIRKRTLADAVKEVDEERRKLGF